MPSKKSLEITLSTKLKEDKDENEFKRELDDLKQTRKEMEAYPISSDTGDLFLKLNKAMMINLLHEYYDLYINGKKTEWKRDK